MEELRAGNIIVVGEVEIVPIERSLIQTVTGDMGCWLSGLKEPFAIIVCDALGGIRAFDMEAIEISVESLIHKIPNIYAVLSSSRKKNSWAEVIPDNCA